MKNISAIILAAGKGKRMKSDIPKVLHQVSGMPMILLVIDILKKAGINKIVVVVGFGADSVRKILPGDIIIVNQGEPLGTGHAVQCTKKVFSGYKGDLLIVCGDMPLIKTDTIKALVRNHYKNKSDCTVLTGILKKPDGYGRIVRDKNENVIRIMEDKDSPSEIKAIKEINSGTYCFKAEKLFDALARVDTKNKQGEFYLTDTVGILNGRGSIVKAFCVDNEEEICGISSRRDLAYVQEIMNRRIIEKHMDNGVTIVDPATTFIDVRAKIGRDTVINPFTVIRGDVTIGSHCEVGPFTHLRDKTVLSDTAEVGNFVEVKKTRIGRHTKAKHLTYLGDAIIGENVNIGAGTITANYDGKNKHQTVIKDKVFIGSNTTIVAPVVIGRGAVTGAGSVVLRNRNVPANTVVVGVPAKELRKIK